MSAVYKPTAMTPEAARQSVEQLSAIYEISKMFSVGSDPRAIERSGLFQPTEVAQLEWIRRDPNVRQLLEDYASKREELLKMDKETVRMWNDGTQGTTEQHEAIERAMIVQGGLNAVTANLLGAIGSEVGRQMYPDDPAQQTRVAKVWATAGEMLLTMGEAHEAGEKNSKLLPGYEGMEQYAPGKKDEEIHSEPPNSEGMPLGGKTFQPYEREVESPEAPELPEAPEWPEQGDEHFDMGLPMAPYQPEPFTDGPNESVPMEDSPNQSLPDEPNASFPEDESGLQSNSFPRGDSQTQSESFEPNQSFSDDFRGQSMSFEPNESFSTPDIPKPPENSFPNQSLPDVPESSFPSDPIVSSSMSSGPSFSSEPPPMQSMPTEPIQSAPIESAPIESAPIESMPSEPMSSTTSMQSIEPAYDPG